MLSRFLASKFPKVRVAVPVKLRDRQPMDTHGKERAAAYASALVARMGWNAARLADEAEVDTGTVRDFLEGRRWPWAVKRNAMERALDVPIGTFELAARGVISSDPIGDAVEQAILASDLNRSNKHKLIGAYYDMLEEQERRSS